VLATAAPTSPLVISFTPPGASAVNVTLDLGSGINGITSFVGTSTTVLRDQNGCAAGQLQNFSIDRTSLITGAFTNGTNVVLGQIVLRSTPIWPNCAPAPSMRLKSVLFTSVVLGPQSTLDPTSGLMSHPILKAMAGPLRT
jgi:hypothetical protein